MIPQKLSGIFTIWCLAIGFIYAGIFIRNAYSTTKYNKSLVADLKNTIISSIFLGLGIVLVFVKFGINI
ncbi:hypothetical protein LY90DRAFT_697086 [Neocallimastix californiae]|uniref:Dolichyl-diphosphooligosaccharide-protein glycosyltransferase subunit OST5 n=1 Tax=Neocallimastix californiae TaxID=1754190 RepID=A0A1Y2FPW4_9FUNG|nr:hypothetical protein LY90DRAFT_697086 [Neocallimastix californiae]|eukprot:ORY85246.1 hypothetical protein LY90DRAFT_697086 [Neocallimastix californiae]